MDRHQLNEARKLAEALFILVKNDGNPATIKAAGELCNYLIDTEDKLLAS